METENYYIAGNDGSPDGPFTKEELRKRAVAQLLAPDTLVSWPHAKRWVKASKLIKRSDFPGSADANLWANFKLPMVWVGGLGLLVLILATLGWSLLMKKQTSETRSEPAVEPERADTTDTEKVSGTAVPVDPMARWYLFGYFYGSQRREVNTAFSAPQKPRESDLAHVFDALGSDLIAPDQFQFAFEGYSDGLSGVSMKFVVPSGTLEDGFPTALESLWEFPIDTAMPTDK